MKFKKVKKLLTRVVLKVTSFKFVILDVSSGKISIKELSNKNIEDLYDDYRK